LISSVAYGVATAAKGLTVAPDSRVLVLQDDHASPVLEWMTRSAEQGFTVETVERPRDGDWTAALLASIARPGAAPIAIASISWVHWSDGGLVDLATVGAALRAQGAALLVDATHGVGVLPLDVKALDPDFVVFPTYKWLLGPYGRAFLYVAKRHQERTPLEQTAFGRRAVRAGQATYFADTRYLPNARRFDMGERDHFVSLEMASIGMEMVSGWGSAAIVERISMLTARLVDGLGGLNLVMPPTRMRAPHLLCLDLPGLADGLVSQLAAENVHIAARLGRVRISPHVYNDEADVERFVMALRRAVSP
jgi:selenocysteine lyase/cysteine desulfurase